MSGGEKKLIHKDSSRSSLLETRTEPDLPVSQLKRAVDKSSILKSKPKSKANVSTALLKNREAGSKILLSKKILNKAHDKKSSKKHCTLKLKLQDEKSSLIIPKGNATDADGDGKLRKLKRRKSKKKKKQRDNVEPDEPSRLQRRARYLLIKMKLEQNLIDAYSGEGWKGQSREKIRPEKELQRANKQIFQCKLGLRDAIRQLDLLSSVGCIEDSVIAPDGSVYHEHIFCAKCKLREAFPDNDIILCDGTCNCAFHQKCLDPPLETENIPLEDQGWFCKFCDCKMDILEAMNAHLGTHFSVDSNWQDIFSEEAAFPDGVSGLLNSEEQWPSDDSEDDDYNPERKENSANISGEGNNDNASEDTSSSTSLSWSLDGEVLSESRRLEEGADSKNNSFESNVDYDDPTDGEVISGRRQRRAVDYKKLYDEMFGKDAPVYEQVSEDEDWGPAKRRRKEKESDAASTLMTLYESKKKIPNMESTEANKKPPSDPHRRRPFFRIPSNAVEKLRQVFADNELPSKVVKENLSKELGLELEKVSKWFKNARYMSLKTRKVEGVNGDQDLTNDSIRTLRCSNFEAKNKKVSDSVSPKVASTETEVQVHTPKNLEMVCRMKKSLNSTNRKLHRTSLESPANSNKAILELSDDISLKKLLKEKTKEKKMKVNIVGGSKEMELEMERLSRARNRLENLKQKLQRFKIEKGKKKSRKTYEQAIIYVPIAQLRERV